MLPRPGQIWKLVDKEAERFVRVAEVTEIKETGIHAVAVTNVRKQTGVGWVPTKVERSYINANRFQGQPGGFILHKKE